MFSRSSSTFAMQYQRSSERHFLFFSVLTQAHRYTESHSHSLHMRTYNCAHFLANVYANRVRERIMTKLGNARLPTHRLACTLTFFVNIHVHHSIERTTSHLTSFQECSYREHVHLMPATHMRIMTYHTHAGTDP
jgi:hypothetical protein